MKLRHMRRSLGIKFYQIAQSLLGTTYSRDGSSESAGPHYGPGFIASLSMIPTVYRCVTVKANDKARVPLVIGRRRKDGVFKPLGPKDGPVLDASGRALFESINPNEGPAAFWARAYQMQQLTGDLFIQIERLKRKTPQELWLLQSDNITILKGAARRPSGYELKVGTEVVRLKPEDVFHTKLPNAGDDWRGLPPLAAAQKFAWLQELIAKNNVELIKNGGVPPGWISIKGPVSLEEREELRNDVRRRSGGPENANRIGILWDDMDFVRGGETSKDGDFPALSDEAKEMICSCFGVPPVYVMNLKQAKYDNMIQQKEMYWFSTLIPELQLLAQDLTSWLRVEYGDDELEAVHDLEKVEAIQDLRLVRAEALQRLVAGGLYTQNEARVDLGKPKATGGDALYFPQALQPTGTVVVPQPAKALPAFGRKAWIDDPARHAKRADSERDLASFVPELERVVVDLEKRIEAQVRAGFAKSGRALTKDDETIDWDGIEGEYETTLGRAYAKVVGLRGQAALDGVIDDDFFDLTIPGVAEWIENVAGEQGRLIVGTMKDDLRTLFAESNALEETATEFSTRLRDFFDLRRDQANRIAWTETGKAYNFGTLEGFRQSEVVSRKEWLSAGDDLVRDAHREADGQQVGLEEFFVVDGELLEFPGAPGGSAENIINCRCAMQPVIDEGMKAARQVRLRSRITIAVKDLDELFAEPTTNGAR